MSEDIVEKMNRASLAENHIQLKARIEELEAKLAIAMRCVRYYAAAPSCERAREFLEEINAIGDENE